MIPGLECASKEIDVLDQMHITPARRGWRLDGLCDIGRNQTIGECSIKNLTDLPQNLPDGARRKTLRPGAQGAGDGARFDRSQRSAAERGKGVIVEHRSLSHTRRIGGQRVRVGRPVLLGKRAEGDRGTLGVDIAAGHLRRFDRSEVTLGIHAPVEHLDLLLTARITKAR
ncbi:MAG TPA: hypothetical protein VFE19_10475, partial [Jatrophihabitantaceae bacterium]|nr:hypothetical protein [Jatrophihabitantaceae bacterium]